MKLSIKQQSYWHNNLRIIGLLLGLWFAVSFVLMYFAQDMTFIFFGWPFSYWLGGQGAPLLYCVIVTVYAGWMNRLDVAHEVDEEQP